MLPVDDAIDRALAYLQRQQLSSGAFSVSTWTDPPGVQSARPDSCTFPTAAIARSLSFSGSAAASAMRARAVDFLKREMEPGGVWRYWSSDNPGRTLIPPDLDDTACASAVLRAEGVSIPNHSLFLANRDSRGLFYTWITPRFRWNSNVQYWKTSLKQLRRPGLLRWFWQSGTARPDDVDCVVNANVLLYLGRGPWTGPVIQFVVDAVRQDVVAQHDKWYYNPFVIAYFISRAYAGGVDELEPARGVMIDRLLTTGGAHAAPGRTPIETAMAICVWLNFQVEADLLAGTRTLMDAQRDDGGWDREEVYRGGATRWGSEAWTTAFCLEALVRAQARTT